MNIQVGSRSGNTMPFILFFSAVAFITLSIFLAYQTRSTKVSFRSPSDLQALLNARSGVYKAIHLFTNDLSTEDTLPTISTTNPSFSMGMFDDRNDITLNDGKLRLDGEVQTITLYDNDSSNSADVALTAQGIYCLISSEATVLDITRLVEAKLGSGPPALPDTVLILENNNPVRGSYRGTVIRESDDQSNKQEAIDRFISEYSSRLANADTSIFETPLTIRSKNAVHSIPDIVRTHLLLDAPYFDITWNEKRNITVLGDLQISGSFNVQNLDFAVAGEIRILDNSKLVNVSLFSDHRIFIGDNATFEGNAISMGTINLYGRAEAKNRSSFMSLGKRSSSNDSGSTSQNYSILISEASRFDGTAIAIGNAWSIKTDPSTQISGILWGNNLVCHGGELAGILRAKGLSDCIYQEISLNPDDEDSENLFSGTIAPLENIKEYKMPYFMGQPKIVSWQEM
ncbi:hypothetical protein QA601_14035 [Chitinispirillales bacterium ANBcel5]|uniref:hypothetical protein n=1 Tax=Cellulosispirillum alkaliphilum TaxID=3039283 RepID=UPI002A555E13|nr:hypothetical protein [Chitinispirillales bacterium ANBcel5]